MSYSNTCRKATELGWTFILAGLISIAAIAPAQGAGCPIEGPDAVGVNESFTLCGLQGYQYTYEWHGPGLPEPTTSRCVTISSRGRAGSYQYQLIVRRGASELERCSQTVNVGGGSFGSLQCVITGPNTIAAGSSAQLCAPQANQHSYQWTGPGGYTASTACIRVSRPGTYSLSIVNDLTGFTRECSHTLEAEDAGGSDCLITGPDDLAPGTFTQLCGPQGSNLSYQWDGPSSFRSSSRCVNVGAVGTYYLTVRNRSTGDQMQCTHRLVAANTGAQDCIITGPESISNRSTAQLCAQLFSNATYSWTGPAGFRSSQRCPNVNDPGVYRVVVRDRSTGRSRECDFTLEDSEGGPDDSDALAPDNCPRSLAFWQRQCRRAADGRWVAPSDFTVAELQTIARRIDERSTFFNWSNDVSGFCAALNPPRPLTNRKQAIRNHAALLANMCAGELSITMRNGDAIGLDPDTPGRFGSARTIGELVALSERMLTRGTGSFSQLNVFLNGVNRGQGIGPVCQ